MRNIIKSKTFTTLLLLSLSTLTAKSQTEFSEEEFTPVTYSEQTMKSVAFDVDQKSAENFVVPTGDKGIIYFNQTDEFVNGPSGKENIWRLVKLDSDFNQEWTEELPSRKKHMVTLSKMIEINDEEYLFALFKDKVSTNSSNSVAQLLQINTSTGESDTYPIETGRFEIQDIIVRNDKIILPGYIIQSKWTAKTCIISTFIWPYALAASPDVTPAIMETDLGSGNFELITDKIKGRHLYLDTHSPDDEEEPEHFYYMKEGKKSETHSIVHFSTSRGKIKKPKEFEIAGDLLSADLRVVPNDDQKMFIGTFMPGHEQVVTWKNAIRNIVKKYQTTGIFMGDLPAKGLAKTRTIDFTELPSVVEYFNKHVKDESILRSSKNPKKGNLTLNTIIHDVYVDKKEIVVMLEVFSPVYDIYGEKEAVHRGYRHNAFITAAFDSETKDPLWDVTFIASGMIDKKPTKTVDYTKTEDGFLFMFSNGYQIIQIEIENGKLIDTEQDLVAIPQETKKLINKHSKNYVVSKWYEDTFVASGYKSVEGGSSKDRIFFISKLQLTE